MKNRKIAISIVFLLTLSMMLIAGCSKDDAKPAGSASGEAEIKSMSGEELVKQNSAEEKDQVLIIDVRSEEEYKAGHIPHAINIFIDEMEGRLEEIEDYEDKPIILYCNTGNRSGKAAEILVSNGFKDVTNAQGVKEFEYDLVHYKDVRGAVFQKMIDGDKDIILVDVRPEKQVIEEGMIEGAINVPFDALEENLDKLPKDKTLALYCNTGTRSSEVAKQLEGLGYENVVNAIEGVKEYSFTLVK